jgi:membrane fusion protein, heavy metal efflux system
VGCLIEPSQFSEVAAQSSGTISQILVDRGSFVRKGQPLAILSSELERANLEAVKQRASSEAEIDAASAARDLAKLKLRKTHELMALGHGTQYELDQAKVEYEITDHRLQHTRDVVAASRKDLSLAQSQLELRTIRSPIDGVVAERMLNVGERVDGRALFKIVNISRLKAELVLPAAQFGTMREGMAIRVQPEVNNSPAVLGQVSQVDRFLDAGSGTFRARLLMNNFDQKIPAGAKCKIEIAQEQPKAGAVPQGGLKPASMKPPAQSVVPKTKPVHAPAQKGVHQTVEHSHSSRPQTEKIAAR